MSNAKKGRPRKFDEPVEKKTISLDKWKMDKVLAVFPNLSMGIDMILSDWIARNNDLDCQKNN